VRSENSRAGAEVSRVENAAVHPSRRLPSVAVIFPTPARLTSGVIMATLRQTIEGGETSQNFATAFAGRAGLAASLSSCAWCGQCANGQGNLNLDVQVRP